MPATSENNPLPPPPIGPLPINPGSIDPGNSLGSSAAAIARSTASSLAFIFKKPPLRFFRPVKISTYAALQAMAEERGRPISVKFVQSVIKKEGPYRFILNHVLPPFCFNTVIGLTLFTTYSTVESQLGRLEADLPVFLTPALAGGLAGAAQSLISYPLDNLKLLQVGGQSTSPRLLDGRKLEFKGWLPLLKQVLLPLSCQGDRHSSAPIPADPGRLKVWASRGWGMLGLSVVKDSLGFASFFTIFQLGRDVGKRLGSHIDRSMTILRRQESDDRRGWTGRILQSFVIVFSGATAGWMYGIIAEPFERARRLLWQARLHWATRHSSDRNPVETAKEGKKTGASPTTLRTHFELKRIRAATHHEHVAKSASASGRPGRVRISDPPVAGERCKKPPSMVRVLRKNLMRSRGWGEMGWLFQGPRVRATDSNSSSGMKLGAAASLFDPVRPRTPHRPALASGRKVTGFRTFILSPYSIGFFVWAVCSGDLTV